MAALPTYEAIRIARAAAEAADGTRDYVLSQEEARAIKQVCSELEDHERIILR